LLVRHKLANQHVKLVRDLQPDLPLVSGDATQLEQVFLNLILNAAEAMPKGGTLTVKTSALPPNQVTVTFKDTGSGMSKEQQQRAFKTILSTTKAKGTGLGLAIVGRIMETHHGQVQIKSRQGRGTTIILTLPVK
jgi:two-component system NtrC family sensor kinase